MAKTIIHHLTLWVGAICLAAVAAQPALADDDKVPVISEVFVTFDPSGDPLLNTLTITGKNLLGRSDRYETKVMLGDRGPLEILPGATGNRIIANCFVENDPPQDDFECNEGDYKLRVTIVRLKRNWNRHDDDKGHRSVRQATYDLTIRSNRAGGCPCYGLFDVFTSYETSCGLTRLVNPPPGPQIFLTDRTSLPEFRFNVAISRPRDDPNWKRTCRDTSKDPSPIPITPEEAVACSTIMETALGSCTPPP